MQKKQLIKKRIKSHTPVAPEPETINELITVYILQLYNYNN